MFIASHLFVVLTYQSVVCASASPDLLNGTF
jgi:hypothetical protein